MGKTLKTIKLLILLAIIITLGMGGYILTTTPKQSVDPPPLEESTLKTTAMEIPQGSILPVDKLVITPARQAYESDQLVLKVPILAIDVPIKNGTTIEVLKTGPGLYDYAQLPQEAGANVSIAGHRDIYGNIFYDIDKLGAGDLFYLVHEGLIYQYQYQETKVVEADDWSVVFTKGYNCLTLTSCTPIGVSSHRIIVTAELISVEQPGDEYDFAPPVPISE